MKQLIAFIALLFYFHGFTQVVPNVSADSLTTKLLPVYFDAFKSGIYDQPRDTGWQNLKKYESGEVSFKVPDKWLNLGGLGAIVEVAFDASDLYFSDTFNSRPVLVGVFLLHQRGGSLEETRDAALKDYRTNLDRVFEIDYVDSVNHWTLPGREKGYILHTRFYRKSNQLNQSRYDLILFSEKLKKGYSLMLSVQYADPTYSFERDNALGCTCS